MSDETRLVSDEQIAKDREVTARIAEQLSKVRYSGRATRDELKLPRGVRAIIR
jgi:hypothetical protein